MIEQIKIGDKVWEEAYLSWDRSLLDGKELNLIVSKLYVWMSCTKIDGVQDILEALSLNPHTDEFRRKIGSVIIVIATGKIVITRVTLKGSSIKFYSSKHFVKMMAKYAGINDGTLLEELVANFETDVSGVTVDDLQEVRGSKGIQELYVRFYKEYGVDSCTVGNPIECYGIYDTFDCKIVYCEELRSRCFVVGNVVLNIISDNSFNKMKMRRVLKQGEYRFSGDVEVRTTFTSMDEVPNSNDIEALESMFMREGRVWFTTRFDDCDMEYPDPIYTFGKDKN